MRARSKQSTVTQSGGTPSDSTSVFSRMSTSVVLIGLIYGAIAAIVLHLLGSALWTLVAAFFLGGVCAMKIAVMVRASILRKFHCAAPLDPFPAEKSSAPRSKPNRAEPGESHLSP